MIPPVGDVRPFLVNPYNLPNVKENEPLTAESENVIRNFITENDRASSTNGLFPTSVIGVFRALSKDGDRVTAVRQFNSANPTQTPVFSDTGKEISDIFDNEASVEEGSIFLARWDTSDGVWYAIGGCESSSDSGSSDDESKSEESESGCRLGPCCNYWGIVTDVDGSGDVTAAKVYDHQGTYICEVNEILDWVECELVVGDVIAIDTDPDAFPKLTPDPCLAVDRACHSRGSSSEDESSSIESYDSPPACNCDEVESKTYNGMLNYTSAMRNDPFQGITDSTYGRVMTNSYRRDTAGFQGTFGEYFWQANYQEAQYITTPSNWWPPISQTVAKHTGSLSGGPQYPRLLAPHPVQPFNTYNNKTYATDGVLGYCFNAYLGFIMAATKGQTVVGSPQPDDFPIGNYGNAVYRNFDGNIAWSKPNTGAAIRESAIGFSSYVTDADQELSKIQYEPCMAACNGEFGRALKSGTVLECRISGAGGSYTFPKQVMSLGSNCNDTAAMNYSALYNVWGVYNNTFWPSLQDNGARRSQYNPGKDLFGQMGYSFRVSKNADGTWSVYGRANSICAFQDRNGVWPSLTYADGTPYYRRASYSLLSKPAEPDPYYYYPDPFDQCGVTGDHIENTYTDAEFSGLTGADLSYTTTLIQNCGVGGYSGWGEDDTDLNGDSPCKPTGQNVTVTFTITHS